MDRTTSLEGAGGPPAPPLSGEANWQRGGGGSVTLFILLPLHVRYPASNCEVSLSHSQSLNIYKLANHVGLSTVRRSCAVYIDLPSQRCRPFIAAPRCTCTCTVVLYAVLYGFASTQERGGKAGLEHGFTFEHAHSAARLFLLRATPATRCRRRRERRKRMGQRRFSS